jgi:vancomycin permeability regulator SanA
MKKLKWIAVTSLVAAALSALLIVVAGLMDDIQTSDVAVILGSKVELNGQPSARLAARLDKGLALYRTGVTTTLIVSGGTGVEGFSEAIIMRDYLSQRGVPLANIIVDENGFNTDATAKNCAAIMRARGFHSVIVVTQYFHIARTTMALRFQDVRNVHSAHAHYLEMRDIYSTAREALALPVYWISNVYRGAVH